MTKVLLPNAQIVKNISVLTEAKVAINSDQIPGVDIAGPHPELAVCGRAYIGPDNGANLYYPDTPTLWVKGKIGVGELDPFTNSLSSHPPSFDTDASVKFHVFGNVLVDAEEPTSTSAGQGDIVVKGTATIAHAWVKEDAEVGSPGGVGDLVVTNMARIHDIDPLGDDQLTIDAPTTIQDKVTTTIQGKVKVKVNGKDRAPLLHVKDDRIINDPSDPRHNVPAMVVGKGFIGQLEGTDISDFSDFYKNSGSGDLAYDENSSRKFVVIGTSGHRTHEDVSHFNDPIKINFDKFRAVSDVDYVFKRQYRETLRNAGLAVVDLIGDVNDEGAKTPLNKYGVRVQWNASMAAFQLVQAADAVLSWGGDERHLLRFRYVGPRVVRKFRKKGNVSLAARYARDIMELDPLGVLRVRGAIISYRKAKPWKRKKRK